MIIMRIWRSHCDSWSFSCPYLVSFIGFLIYVDKYFSILIIFCRAKSTALHNHLDANSLCRHRPGFDLPKPSDNLIRLLSLNSDVTPSSFSPLSSSTINRVHLQPCWQSQINLWLLFRIDLFCWGLTCGDEVIVSLTRLQRPSGHLEVRFLGADRQVSQNGWWIWLRSAGFVSNISTADRQSKDYRLK